MKSKCDQHNQTPDKVIRQLQGKEDTQLGWARLANKNENGVEVFVENDITYNECLEIGKDYDYFIFIVTKSI